MSLHKVAKFYVIRLYDGGGGTNIQTFVNFRNFAELYLTLIYISRITFKLVKFSNFKALFVVVSTDSH